MTTPAPEREAGIWLRSDTCHEDLITMLDGWAAVAWLEEHANHVDAWVATDDRCVDCGRYVSHWMQAGMTYDAAHDLVGWRCIPAQQAVAKVKAARDLARKWGWL